MANLIPVIRSPHTEAHEKYASHSGDIYVIVEESQDGAFKIEIIYAASPTDSNFNDAPNGSLLVNTTDWTMKRKTGDTTWATITQS